MVPKGAPKVGLVRRQLARMTLLKRVPWARVAFYAFVAFTGPAMVERFSYGDWMAILAEALAVVCYRLAP